MTGFRRYYPGLRVALEMSGSTQAMSALIVGTADMAVLSRTMTAEEERWFHTTYGYLPTALPIARDAVAVYVHEANPLRGLTLSQLDAIFSATRLSGYPTGSNHWNDLVADWSDSPVHLYGSNTESATAQFFKELVMRGGAFREDIKIVTTPAQLGSAILVDPFAIGYSSLSSQRSGIRAVPLAKTASDPFVVPSLASVQNGSYPLSRLLYLYVSQSPHLPMIPAVEEFLRYIASREGYHALINHGLYPVESDPLLHPGSSV